VLARFLYASRACWASPESRTVKKSKDFRARVLGPVSVPHIYPTSLTVARKLIKIYFARSYIIQDMCCTTYSASFSLCPQLFPQATRPQQRTPRSSVSSGRLQFYYTRVVLPLILTLIGIYVLGVVNCVFIVCLCTTFHVVAAFCQLPNKRLYFVVSAEGTVEVYETFHSRCVSVFHPAHGTHHAALCTALTRSLPIN